MKANIYIGLLRVSTAEGDLCLVTSLRDKQSKFASGIVRYSFPYAFYDVADLL
jgi:hypothetical protein